MNNIWLDGVMGVVVGDALGNPVQFMSRKQVKKRPVTKMESCRRAVLPAGTWTDDSSLTLASLSSLKDKQDYDLKDIAERFVDWLVNGNYTPFGKAFDIGESCLRGIRNFNATGNPYTCGTKGEYDNGNGSLMRIIPICLYQYEKMKN